MANILELIDKKDNFEIVRDEIAAILAVEKENQKVLAAADGQDPDLWNFDVYAERSSPWELVEDSEGKIVADTPLVNVFFDSASSNAAGSNNIEQQLMEGTFTVDCVAAMTHRKAEGETFQHADELAAKEAQRIIRLVRNILMAGSYTYLGMRGVVLSREIQNIAMFQPQINDRPAEHVMVARLQLKVQYYEFSPQAEPEELELMSAQCINSDGKVLFRTDYDYTE
ncbi:MAG: hypothetical protein KA369_08265 [Spirochaetes bacterium]|nr:hypothetical protein [Spirochaetota bacterium]